MCLHFLLWEKEAFSTSSHATVFFPLLPASPLPPPLPSPNPPLFFSSSSPSFTFPQSSSTFFVEPFCVSFKGGRKGSKQLPSPLFLPPKHTTRLPRRRKRKPTDRKSRKKKKKETRHSTPLSHTNLRGKKI